MKVKVVMEACGGQNRAGKGRNERVLGRDGEKQSEVRKRWIE